MIFTTDRLKCNYCHEPKPASDFSIRARQQAEMNDPNAMCMACVGGLFRSRKSPDEIPAYLAEDTNKRLQKYRLPNQQELQNAPARMGRPMHHSELILKLRRIVSGLHAIPGNIVGDISLCVARSNTIEYVTYCHKGYMPELSIAHVDAQNLPSWEERGWTTVVKRFEDAGLITAEQARKEFGIPSR
jgi:hypothetical protein